MVGKDLGAEEKAARDYWTPERFAAAQPYVGVATQTAAIAAGEAALAAPERPSEAGGRAPVAGIEAQWNPLLEDAEPAAAAVVPRAKASSGGAVYTSAGLVPPSADNSYPYTTIGKLYFVADNHQYYCSGAVQRYRVIVTAAQCINDGSTNGFFSNFVFVPAERDHNQPYGQWLANYVVVPAAWTQGGGNLPNQADYGFVVVSDHLVDGSMRRIGEVTGYVGYATQKLRPNHAHILGYADVFNGGNRMRQVTSPAYKAGRNGTVIYGGDLGAAGAPMLQDFGDNANLVKVIGVVSYRVTGNVKQVGASNPDARFASALQNACSHAAGNC